METFTDQDQGKQISQHALALGTLTQRDRLGTSREREGERERETKREKERETERERERERNP